MARMRLFVAFLLLATALAGCADSAPAQTAGSEEEAFQELEGEATATTGLIRGVVVDEAIVPIAGATIKIKALDLETTSNDMGAFLFSDLEPGTYFMDVSKLGYDKVQAQQKVEAGVAKPPVVRVQLTSDPSSLPFAVPIVWNGFIECSLRAGTANMAGSVGLNACNGVGQQDVNFPHGDIGADPQYVQAEMLWDSTQSSGDELSLVVGPPDCRDVKYTRADGPSPLIYGLNAEKLVAPSGSWGPVGPDQSICTRVFTYTSGTLAHLWGMQVQQQFEVYIHTFYGFTPTEGWKFSTDGEPVPPS